MQSIKLVRSLTNIGIQIGSMRSVANQLALAQDGYVEFLKEVIEDSVEAVTNSVDIVMKIDGSRGFTDDFNVDFKTSGMSDVERLTTMRFTNLRLLNPLQEIYSSYSVMSHNGTTSQLPDELKENLWSLINNTILLDVYLTRASKGVFEV